MNPSQASSDEQLLLQAANGDKQAYGVLYERYLEAIYRFVLIRVGCPEIAEDLTEDAFIRTWEYLPRLGRRNGKIDHLKAFLYRTANNLVIDFYRKKKPDPLSPDQATPIWDSPEETYERQDEITTLLKGLRQLRPEYQKIIVLRYANQLSHQETAAILNISEAHSRVLQFRALKRLASIIKKEA